MAVSYDAGSSVGFEASSSASWTHTPVGTPTAVFVFVSWTGYPTNPSTVSGVTYGGQAMTAVPSSQANNDTFQGTTYRGSVQGFYLNNPPSGPQTVAVTFSSASYGRAGATTVTGPVATTPYGTPATASGSNSLPSATVGSSTAGNLVLGAFVSDYTTGGITAGRTLSWSGVSGGAAYGGGAEYAAAGGSQTMNWAVTIPTGKWAATAFEVLGNPAPTNSVAPAVSGTAQVGQTLTTTNGTWTGSPTSYAYQWKRADNVGFTTNVTNIGSNQNTFALTASESGKYVRCVVTATNAGGSTAANSNIVGDVLPAAPTNAVAPSCSPSSGTTADNFVFSSGTWTGSPTSWFWEYRTAGSGPWTAFDTVQNPTVAGSVFGVGSWDTRLTATNAGGPSNPPANGTTITVTQPGNTFASLTLTGAT